jgi:hypothetical protein
MHRLSYANVVSTLALFLVLSGGAAYAAHRYLTRKSVGAPQLKSNAVTTAKIKANAVTTRKIKRIAVSGDKIKEDAVSTEKLADNAVDAEKIDLEKVPFGRVVARMRTNGSLPIGEGAVLYPMTDSGYTQAANELDTFVGQLEVTIPVKCMGKRTIQANVVVDAKKPTEPPAEDIVATGFFEDNSSSALSVTIPLEPPEKGPRFIFEPGAPTAHQVSLVINPDCGGGGEMTASSAAVDVLGTR